MANKHKKVWKVIFRKPLSGKQTQLKEKHFPEKQAKYFPLTGKCFPLINFCNDKQTQESLENGFPETTFRETNMASIELDLHACVNSSLAKHQLSDENKKDK